ncbi:MAG TPA: hypothetical protein PLV65_02505, partial [Tenuifilaceae bacterium]|nr:hypothetical protein [Tenuifilaceae bacterium]
MDKNTIIKAINNCFIVKEINENKFQILTQAKMQKKPVVLFLEKINDKWLLMDKKQTIKLMNKIYELNAPDVKNCITNVI